MAIVMIEGVKTQLDEFFKKRRLHSRQKTGKLLLKDLATPPEERTHDQLRRIGIVAQIARGAN